MGVPKTNAPGFGDHRCTNLTKHNLIVCIYSKKYRKTQGYRNDLPNKCARLVAMELELQRKIHCRKSL